MRLLLDSHALIWAVDDPTRFPTNVPAELRAPANELWVSAATIWELSIKCSLGKLTLSLPFRIWIEQAMNDIGAAVLPVTIPHADRQVQLPFHHRDPFDRLLIAQALVEDMTIVSNETLFDVYGVVRLW